MKEGETVTTLFVTDIEADGPDPALNSMISFASVALSENGQILDQFSANLIPRPDRKPDSRTMKWWETQHFAYAAATCDAKPASDVMQAYALWVESFAGERTFAARPLLFDGTWIDDYLKTFAGSRVFGGPFDGRQVFTGNGIDIMSYLQGMFGWPLGISDNPIFPTDWLGNIPHSHRAIDDAMGYANVLSRALKLNSEQPVNIEDF